MCIRRETREKARRSLAFSPVSKPHTHITYMLRQCTCIVYLLLSIVTDHYLIVQMMVQYTVVIFY